MVAIFVALMFVGLVLTDLGVAKWRAWRAAQAGELATNAEAFRLEALWQVPEGVHLSSAHTWFRPDPAGGLQIGVDPLIPHAFGAVGRIVLPNPGDQVTTGQPLFRLEQDGRSITVPCTITGNVMAVNSHLQDQPGLLNSDPYGSGWICHVTPTSIGAMAPKVQFGEKAILWLESEFTRLGEFLSAQMPAEMPLGATSQDGGLPISGCLGALDHAAWGRFESEFLKWK
jgi:glycine cleavage system H protein